MNKKKTIGMSLAILGILLAVYHLLVFVIFKPITSVFWISYLFMLLAFGLQVVGFYLSFKEMNVKAVFFGIPLAQFTVFYFFAELFMSVVFMCFQQVSPTIPIVLQLLLLAVYAIVAIVSIFARDTVVAAENKVKTNVAAMRLKTADIEMLRDAAEDPELKNQLRRLAEAIRYSDPMTNDAIADVDARIRQETLALQTYCDDRDIAAAKDSCAKLQRLYVERNKKLMASK